MTRSARQRISRVPGEVHLQACGRREGMYSPRIDLHMSDKTANGMLHPYMNDEARQGGFWLRSA